MWENREDYNDDTLARLASIGVKVMLVGGSTATLVYWPCAGRRGDGTRHRARVQFENMRRRTVPKGEVVAIWGDVPVPVQP